MDKKTTGPAKGYLHGFTKEEQERLYQQARFLERIIYEKVDLRDHRLLLEIGCGVGAQTEILLERFPQLEIYGIDASKEQIAQAEHRLATPIKENRVHLKLGDASHLPYQESFFDAAFICWFLEHVSQPLEILKETRRVLKPNGVVYCTEVLNATFYLHPYSPATLQYWFAFNDHQWTLGGDPFVGAKLGNYFIQAGFQEIQTEIKSYHYDNRTPKMRSQMFGFWTKLLLSGTPQLLESKKVSPELVEEMKKELAILTDASDSVFFYSCVQAHAKAF